MLSKEIYYSSYRLSICDKEKMFLNLVTRTFTLKYFTIIIKSTRCRLVCFILSVTSTISLILRCKINYGCNKFYSTSLGLDLCHQNVASTEMSFVRMSFDKMTRSPLKVVPTNLDSELVNFFGQKILEKKFGDFFRSFK
jgi:hypothetical protein